MASSDVRSKERLRKGVVTLLTLALVAGVGIAISRHIGSLIKDEVIDYHIDSLGQSNVDETDPSTLAPHHGFPWVIVDDELCRITVHGTDALRLSYHGFVFDFTIENKTDDLTIFIWNEREWTATGEALWKGSLERVEDVTVTYHGPMNEVGPGESLDGQFSLFSKKYNYLYDVESFYGLLEIRSSHGTDRDTVGVYPFSYER